jgi:hypothetical protein
MYIVILRRTAVDQTKSDQWCHSVYVGARIPNTGLVGREHIIVIVLFAECYARLRFRHSHVPNLVKTATQHTNVSANRCAPTGTRTMREDISKIFCFQDGDHFLIPGTMAELMSCSRPARRRLE